MYGDFDPNFNLPSLNCGHGSGLRGPGILAAGAERGRTLRDMRRVGGVFGLMLALHRPYFLSSPRICRNRSHYIRRAGFVSPISFMSSPPYFSSCLVFVSLLRGHIAGTPLPPLHRCAPSFSSREEFSIFPRRHASNRAYTPCSGDARPRHGYLSSLSPPPRHSTIYIDYILSIYYL